MTSPRRSMYSLIALLLSASSYAQDSRQCSGIAPLLAYNASSSVTIPALSVTIPANASGGDMLFSYETSFNWTLSSYIRPFGPNPPDTETYLWLDVGDSDLERLGQTMRACHTVVPLQLYSGYANVTWSHETLEKSVQDKGDCRTMVSEECLARLRSQYFNAGTSDLVESSRRGCAGLNTTVPWECASSGMVMPRSLPVPEFNASLSSHFPLIDYTQVILNDTEQLICDGRNFSRSFGNSVAVQNYDLGINFPIMDIMTFFPMVPPGRPLMGDAEPVQIACLVPGEVTKGSRAKASVQDVLGRHDSTGGGNQTAGAANLGGVGMWKMMAWALGLGFVFGL